MLRFFRGNTPERRVERLIAKGERLFQHGREREGLEKFTEAANVLPEASKPSLHLGRAYAKLKHYPIALKHYYKALYFSDITEEPGILFEIAQIYMWMKRYDIVEEKLKKVLRLELPLSPSQIDTIQHTAMRALIQLYLRTGRISDAITRQKALLEHTPEDLKVIRLLADSHRRLGEYREARLLLRKAVELAHYSGQQAECVELEQKLREVGFSDGTEFGIKEQLYAEYRNLCLGTAGDDGLKIPFRESLPTISLPECIVTLRRLIEFIHAFGWPITGIVPGDKYSTRVASILAHLLKVPIIASSRVKMDEHILLCQTLYTASKPIKKLLRTLRKRTESIVTFSLVTILPDEPIDYMPDIIGIPVKQEAAHDHKQTRLMFSRPSPETDYFATSDNLSSEQFIQRCLTVFAELSEECYHSEQVAYYFTHNTHIREHLVPASPSANSLSAFHAQQSIETLVSQLLSKQQEETLIALAALQKEHGQQPLIVNTLKTLFRTHQDTALRRIIGKTLLTIAHNEGMIYLVDMFQQQETDVFVKRSIVETLGNSSNRHVSPVITSALQSSHDDLRKQAIHYLHLLDLSTDLSSLFERLLGDLPDIIVKTLRYLRTDMAVPYSSLLPQCLHSLLHHSDASVVYESLNTLQWCKERTFLPDVIDLLTHNDPTIVEQALRTLGAIGDSDSGVHLVPFLERSSPRIRYVAAESFAKLDRQQSVVFLMERLRQETPEVQEGLLALLGRVGSQEITPYILQFAEQHIEHFSLVLAVVKTFSQWRDPRSLPFIRKALDRFSHDEMLLEYITIAGNFGEKPDIDRLVGYLGHSQAIRFRVAAVLYTQDLKRYFHILQDGIHSKYVAVNLLTIENLNNIGDELSLQTLFTLFARQKPEIDKKLVEVIGRQHRTSTYAEVFQTLPSSDQTMVLQGIYRAIEESRTIQEAIPGFHALYAVSQKAAIPMMRQFCTSTSSSFVLCGAMRCLAYHDPTESLVYIRHHLSDENITVANTAYVLMTRERENMRNVKRKT